MYNKRKSDEAEGMITLMVILLKGMLPELDYFIERMAESLEEAYVLDISQDTFYKQLGILDLAIDETTDVITFDSVGLDVETSEGLNYWELKSVKFHNIFVDAPICFYNVLERHLKCMQVIVIDRYHKEFINTYYPDYPVEFLPHGGAELPYHAETAYEERQIEVLYAGSRKFADEPVIIESLPDGGRELYHYAEQTLMKSPHMRLEQVFDIYRNEIGIKLEPKTQLGIIGALYDVVLRKVRSHYQAEIIEALASAGVHVDVYYGDEWKEIAEKYPGYITVHEKISPEECLELMHNSKITLNIQPWFKYGAHERIYNAMLNGSVCVTDTSEYLQKYFKNGGDIVFYELNDLDGLVRNVKMLLENPSYAKYIIENQKKVAANSTWRKRIYNILERRFEEGKDFV